MRPSAGQRVDQVHVGGRDLTDVDLVDASAHLVAHPPES
ncbi:hypothetical protein BJ999_000508 [Actinomadura citrea]|uniref:Uncharacterized protein n=1 Tax=Actinomadura citrea TaxID=46158 RepID=A0A7Y9G591_9ACTN|nr:hypothetical protein [Actinomadura citrea]